LREQETITFRIEAEKEALDAIALTMDRDRSYVLNLAISAYLEVNQWQIEHMGRLAPGRCWRIRD